MVMTLLLITLGVVGFLFVRAYNNLVHLETQIQRAWSNIEVMLKQRFDELPQLVQVVEQYAQHEGHLFTQLAEARQHYGAAREKGEKIQASREMIVALGGLLALSENYPELKSNQNFLQLQSRVASLEEALADRRESYNDAVSIFNARIRQLPDVIVANLMGLQTAEVFEASPEERKKPSLKMNLPGQRKSESA